MYRKRVTYGWLTLIAAAIIMANAWALPAWAQTRPAVAGGTIGSGGVALVNINTADEPTLETLNGVGPALAAAIIQYRTDQGPFTLIDQLDEVSGIGPATLEKLRPQVTV